MPEPFGDYFKTRRDFEDLRSNTPAELQERLLVAEEQINILSQLNGNADPHLVTLIRQDATCIRAEIERRKNGKASGSTAIDPLFERMDEVVPEKIDWLWPGRIPLSRATLIDGDPDAGKSYLTLAIAARVTRGEPLPFASMALSPSPVLIINLEDGAGDTVRPRLDQLGADVSKVVIPSRKRAMAATLMNASFIESIVKQVGPSLVVLDPIVAFSSKKDQNANSQIREFLTPLLSLAEKHSFALLIIRHFSKNENVKAMYRGSGSLDYVAAPRSAFVIAHDPQETGRRILAHSKCNIGPKQPSVSFYIDENGFRWSDQVNMTADELVKPEVERGRERHQLEAAKTFLQQALDGGPIPSSKIKEKAEAAGIAWRTIWRAKEDLRIRASKDRQTGGWWWQRGADGEDGRDGSL